MSDRLDPDVLFSRGFKVGSIVRLKMQNFLTYDECEVFTGPRLNIVLGPNGTGKSALTHAICLACCGTTGDVGRSNDLSKFVKHGAEKQESFVEVDILTADRALVTVRREINSENRGSKWYMNRRTAKQTEVKALMTSLSIDVDNLCSFMPQDKVGSFSKFTPKEILSNALRSIQSPDEEYNLFTEQQELSNIQDSKEDYRRRRDAKQLALDTSKRELDAMRTEVQRLERREELQNLLEDYQVRLKAVALGELENQRDAKQEVVDEKTRAFQEEQNRIAPLEERERQLRRDQAVREQAAENARNMQRKIEDALKAKKDTIQDSEMDVDTISNELLLVAKNRVDKERALQNEEDKLAVLEELLQTRVQLVPDLQRRLAAVKVDYQSNQDQLRDCEDAVRQLTEQKNKQKDAVVLLRRELEGLQDFRQQYRLRLQRHSQADPAVRGALSMLEWLDANEGRARQTGQLRGQVFGPVAMHCSVADSACAVMLEKAIPLNRLMGFVVENDNDAELLKGLREQYHWKVDVFTMKRANPDSSRAYSPEDLAALGLKGYLADQLECPDIIRAFFYTFNSLHKVLWGRGADTLSLQQQHELCRREGNFRLYIHEVVPGRTPASQPIITEYKGTVSRNRSLPPSTSSIGVAGKGFVMCGADEDTEQRRTQLHDQLATADAEARRLDKELVTAIEAQKQLIATSHKLRKDLQDLTAGLKEPRTLKEQVDRKKETIRELQHQLSVGVDKERQEKEALYKQAVDSLLGNVNAAVELINKANEHSVPLQVANALRNELTDAILEVEAEVKEAKRLLRELERELKIAERERNELQRRVDVKEAEIKQMIADLKLTEEEYANQVYLPIAQRCPENTVVAIEARIEQIEADLNRIADNPQLLQRFQEVTAEVARYEGELKGAIQEFENAEEALEERAKRWLTLVEKTTEKLNVKFGTYMRELQLRGEVKLVKVGRFIDHELQLLVAFRDNAELTPLDGNKHSGGERAVSTVMFLMALQDMTTSPFRVVDEINQGMDEMNERLVFDRVVKSCCGDASKPQYFLVTPKLLQGLGAMRNDDVTVLLVWNGPGTGTKWVFSDLLDNLSRKVNGVPASTRTAPATSAAPSTGVKVKPEPNTAAAAAGGKRGRQGQKERGPLDSEAESDASSMMPSKAAKGVKREPLGKKPRV